MIFFFAEPPLAPASVRASRKRENGKPAVISPALGNVAKSMACDCFLNRLDYSLVLKSLSRVDSTCCTFSMGSVNVKVAPRPPGLFCAHILPPCASIMLFEM
jgi:hypothetical protein